jgi:hypothetical protein
MAPPLADSSQLFFMNGSAAEIEYLGLVDGQRRSIAEAVGIPSQALTMLVNVPAGSYGARWDPEGGAESRMGWDAKGQNPIVMTTMETGKIYMLLARDQPSIWEIGVRANP